MLDVLVFYRRRTLTWMVVVVAGLAALVGAAGADATFPGRNGLIEFVQVPRASVNSQFALGPITTITENGSGQRKLVSGSFPTFSADGTKVAFVRFSASEVQRSNVLVMNADGSGLRQVTHCQTFCGYPVFTPGGSILYLNSFNCMPMKCVQLWSIGADGQNARLLMQRRARPSGKVKDFSVFINHLAPSPDGTRVAYMQGLGAQQTIYTMALDGSDVHRLTAGYDPDYSPDGQHIVFDRLTHRSGGLIPLVDDEIWVMNADGSGKRRLTSDRVAYPWYGDSPHFSPDGSLIVFAREVRSKRRTNVYVMRPDGSGLRRVTNEPRGVLVASPAWQPKP